MAYQPIFLPSFAYIQLIAPNFPFPPRPVPPPITAGFAWTPASHNVLALDANGILPDTRQAMKDRADLEYVVSHESSKTDVDNGLRANAFNTISRYVMTAPPGHWLNGVAPAIDMPLLERANLDIANRAQELRGGAVGNCIKLVKTIWGTNTTPLRFLHHSYGHIGLLNFFLYYLTFQGLNVEWDIMKEIFGPGSRTGYISQTLNIDIIYYDFSHNITHLNAAQVDLAHVLVDFLRWKAAHWLALSAQFGVLKTNNEELNLWFKQLHIHYPFPGMSHVVKEDLPVCWRVHNYHIPR